MQVVLNKFKYPVGRAILPLAVSHTKKHSLTRNKKAHVKIFRLFEKQCTFVENQQSEISEETYSPRPQT